MTFLSAADAEVILHSAHGVRTVAIASYLADGRSPAELITAVRLPRPCGPQVYLKVGSRQAAAAALVSCALVVDRVRERVACAISGVAGRPIRPAAAEDFVRAGVDWSTGTAPPDIVAGFGELVTEAVRAVADPLPGDLRTSAAYRRHAAGVLAARAAGRCLSGPQQRPAAGAPATPGTPGGIECTSDTGYTSGTGCTGASAGDLRARA